MIDQHNSLAEKFLKKGFWLYLFSFIIAPIGYIIKIIISGELTVSEVGILYGIISLITMISAYNDLGMSESINHFVPKFVTEKRYDKVKTILMYALIAQMITGITIAAFFFFGAEWLSVNYFKSEAAISILKIFAFYFLGINIFQIISTFFISIQNTFANKIIDFFRMGIALLVVLLIFFIDIGSLQYYSYSWITGLYIGIIIAISIFYTKYYSKYLTGVQIIWKKQFFQKILRYSLLVFLGAQAGTILSQVDMQMIIFLLGTQDAGYYTNYLSIIGIPFIIIGPIFQLLFPIFSEMHSKGEYEKINLVKYIFTKNFLSIGLALNILFFVCAEIIAYTLFGEKFLKSGGILQYSILLLVFNFLFQINFFIMAGIGKVKERVKIIITAIIFNIITNIIFISLLGVFGAALATAIGWILIWLLSEYYLGKKFRIQFDYKYLFKNILFLGAIGVVIYFFITPFFDGLSRGQSFILLLIVSLLYFGIFGLFNYSEFNKFYIYLKKIRNE